MDLNGFNANEIPDGFNDPIPSGTYTAIIVDSAERENKRSEGAHLNLKFEIVEGEWEGRWIWTNLNLINTNKMAVQIAKQELAKICKAVGVLEPKDSAELHSKPMRIRVTQKPDFLDKSVMRNEINDFLPVESVAATNEAPGDNSPF